VDSAIQVLWRDRSGTDNTVNGRVIDVSEAGIRIKVPAPIEKGVYVTMSAPKVPLQGTGSVKSCRQQGLSYVIGLEFTSGLRWKAKPKGSEPENK
jgi:PilZ domain